MSEEKVLVIPRSIMEIVLGPFEGFRNHIDPTMQVALTAYGNARFVLRDEAEKNRMLKQLIPYVIFEHREDGGPPWLYNYRRTSNQGESRLHGKRSIGVGGHINPCDLDGGAGLYQAGLFRELREELCLPDGELESVPLVGVINYESDEVGRVHLGLVHRVCVRHQSAVVPREPENITQTGFNPATELLAHISEFETWSQECLKALYGTKP
jgi:predicted NUDIX family phosphoesterase